LNFFRSAASAVLVEWLSAARPDAKTEITKAMEQRKRMSTFNESIPAAIHRNTATFTNHDDATN